MISRRSIALALTIALLSGPAWSAAGNAVKLFDTDNDGTLDLAEVKKAAAALFAKLDPDHDGTLDARELRGRLTAKRTRRGRSRPGWDADARRIFVRGRAALQCSQSRQGWNAGCEGAELARRPRCCDCCGERNGTDLRRAVLRAFPLRHSEHRAVRPVLFAMSCQAPGQRRGRRGDADEHETFRSCRLRDPDVERRRRHRRPMQHGQRQH